MLQSHMGLAILERFSEVRSCTEKLCSYLEQEDFLLSVTEDTSPPKWHLAHTTWFLEHFILEKFSSDYHCYRPEYNFLFNSYYKKIGEYLPKSKRAFISRPSVDEILEYRTHVSRNVLELLSQLQGEKFQVAQRILEIGINHEEQHQELLLMDIKRNFFENPQRPAFKHEVIHHGLQTVPRWIAFEPRLVKIGVPENDLKFSYDNEKNQHQVWLEGFELSTHLITNNEFLAFIDDGGYKDPLLWLSDGWDYKEKEKWKHPLYWEKQGDSWWMMSLAGMVPLDLHAPVVHVSFYEAQAFAKWRGCRLPLESEWETAAKLEPVEGSFLETGHPAPEASKNTHEIFSQIHGSVWEWTSSSYTPYPGYRPLKDGLSEYNEKFMCNQIVLRGGSIITPRRHYRMTYRNFYYPHMRWMHSGIRLAKDLT